MRERRWLTFSASSYLLLLNTRPESRYRTMTGRAFLFAGFDGSRPYSGEDL